MKYVKGSIKLGLEYKRKREINKLDVSCDADYAGDIETRKSTTGYVIFFEGAPISWCSRKQPIVALSSTEAEFIAAAECCKETLYLKNLIKEICKHKINNLRELLSQTSTGKKILSQTRLTPSDRNKICHMIIDKLLCKSTNNKITTEQFCEWAEVIVTVFKYEKVSTYYLPCNTKLKRLASGKLWDKYNNLKKYIKKYEKKVEEKDIELNPELNPDHKEALLKLRVIQPNDPNLENLWKETSKARNRGISIADYYDKYPILKTSIGSVLLQADFELIETQIEAHFFVQKWTEIAPYILQLAEKKEAHHCVN
ncbi:PREDICTED: uncharacterized protein LOC105448717 [Wasmannia auropunctata]|uniref:uncharacterized protein LOC105448717 n=1 Tax=Wasmannia auropunctata TaxID=64793 RepID=UPI0005EDA160|nr:PREDICTED: uncharacterized protein LOC105448717 [Wasmannia auropunctata]